MSLKNRLLVSWVRAKSVTCGRIQVVGLQRDVLVLGMGFLAARVEDVDQLALDHMKQVAGPQGPGTPAPTAVDTRPERKSRARRSRWQRRHRSHDY